MTDNPDTKLSPDSDAVIDESIGAIVPDGKEEDEKAIDLPLEQGDADSQPGA